MVPLGESHTRLEEMMLARREKTACNSIHVKLTLLELELFDTGLIRSDGGTLDTDRVLLDSLGSIDGDLIVGLVTVLEAEIVVLEVNIEVRVDELVLDGLPDDTGHLVAVELDDGVLDLDLGGSHCAVGRERYSLYSAKGVWEETTGTQSSSNGSSAGSGGEESGGEGGVHLCEEEEGQRRVR